MCNISEYFEECGLREGMEKGMAKGKEEGRVEEREANMRNYILATKEDGVPVGKIIENLQRIFMISSAQASEYFKQYSK